MINVVACVDLTFLSLYISIQSCLSTTRPVITLIGCNAVGSASRFFGRQVFYFFLFFFLFFFFNLVYIFVFGLQIASSFMYFATMYFYH